MLAGIEGGGTTWVCSLAPVASPTTLVERASFATTTPDETLSAIKEWLKARAHRIVALGIATFGPIDPKPDSPTYGYITATPKPGWQNTDVVGALKLDVPTLFDTDVNAPAWAEFVLAASCSSLAYVTVGTGVGVGLVINGAPVHGLLHPEAGHIACPQFPGDDLDAAGLTSLNCPNWFEVEAMCATRALARRAHCDPDDLKSLPDDHPVWDAAAHYLASMCANLVLVASPEKIVLSGGVMQRASLFPKIRSNLLRFLNGYIPVLVAADDYIVPSAWGNDAGIVGALFLARAALDRRPARRARFYVPLLLAVASVAALVTARRRAG